MTNNSNPQEEPRSEEIVCGCRGKMCDECLDKYGIEKQERTMRCAKCFIEYDNGEVIAPIDESAIDLTTEIGLGFCVMCVAPAGNPAEV